MRHLSLARRLLCLLVVVAPLCTAQTAPLQNSTRPIRLVDPFPPGSSVDFLARMLEPTLRNRTNQPFVIDYKSGAGGLIGAEHVARAKPDGLTLLITTASTQVIAPAIQKSMRFDPNTELVPIAMLASTQHLVVVHAALPVQSLQELIVHAASRPNALSYGSSGNGTTLHLMGETFKALTKTELVHVPYRGSAPAVADLVSGQIQVLFLSVYDALPYIRSGKIRALAAIGDQRSTILPDVPSTKELGLLSDWPPIWFGLFAPSQTPKGMLKRIADASAVALSDTEVATRLRAVGLNPDYMGGEALMKTILKQQAQMNALVVRAGIRKE